MLAIPNKTRTLNSRNQWPWVENNRLTETTGQDQIHKPSRAGSQDKEENLRLAVLNLWV